MKILGIDPGYGTLGWAVIEGNFKLVDFGAIITKPKLPMGERLLIIYNSIEKIINTYHPEALASERLFFAKNTKTALEVAKAIGVIILVSQINGMNYYEYSPSQVKTAITGYGQAPKEQIQGMIKKIFNLKITPTPDDAADALAIAACHSLSNIKLFKIKQCI